MVSTNDLITQAPIEGQTGQNLLHGFLLRPHNQGPHKDRDFGPIPSNCLKEACCMLAKGGNGAKTGFITC